MTLTAERVRAALRYSPIVGVFEWRQSGRRIRAGGLAGAVVRPSGYVRIVLDGIPYPAHRLAWLYMTGEWPADEVDHIDGDRSNNAWKNLRQATQTTNSWNKRNSQKPSLGAKGVSFLKGTGRWQARVVKNGETWRRAYPTQQEAEAAIVEKRKELHGEFANHGKHGFEIEEMIG